VQEAVSIAVEEAVQAVLTEVLTNRQLQEQLQQVAQHAPPRHETPDKHSRAKSLWQAMTEGARRTMDKVKKLL
jgi:hypothetical protein